MSKFCKNCGAQLNDAASTKVHNIRKYLITAIFNSKSTQNVYFGAEVRYDMYGS